METQSTAVAVVKSEELDLIVKNSGLEITEGEQIKLSYQPFLIQLAEIHEQSTKINWQNPAELDESIARNLRLKTVKIRTGASDLKDERKRSYLLRGNLEQACYNLIAATCKVAENDFTNVEKAREIAEAKRVEELRIARTVELSRLGWGGSMNLNVGKLDDQTYNAMLAGLKKAEEDRIAEEKRIEAERIAREKAAEEERKRMIAENERLRKEAEEKEKALAVECARVEAERKAADDKARKEREAAAKKLAEEQAKADAERKRLEAEAERVRLQNEKKLAEERRIAAEKLAAQQAESKRLADELEAKRDAEEAENRRKHQEEQLRIIAEKKAAAAPDKEKLRKMIDMSVLVIPGVELKSEEAIKVREDILNKFESFKKWAIQLVETL